MKLCIHRGAKEIGGSCVEIEADGQRLLLDLGLPLDAELDETLLPDVSGLETLDESLLGIAISHAHLDHYGLAAKIRQRVPVLIGAGALRIIKAARRFFPETPDFPNTIEMKNKEAISLGPFTITPYLMDHSAYDAFALLVEARGKRLFYSGDFRGHGRKARLFERLLKDPPQNVDVLLMEGSTISRTGVEDEYPSEDELENYLADRFAYSQGLILVWTAGQNIDRIVTIYKACRRTKKYFIADLYTASILMALGNPRLPQPGFKDFLVYVPNSHRIRVKERKLFELAKSVSACRVFSDKLPALARSSVMLFRPSMRNEITRAGCVESAMLVYSMWPGYLKDEQYSSFHDWLAQNRIPVVHCHTSGHAPAADLKRLAEAIAPKKVVPIHTFSPDSYPSLFKNVEIWADGEIRPV